MKLIAVTRIRNEDDIVEAFVRHHAELVDHHIVLDNGSNDRTREILSALRGEGVGISIHTSEAAVSAEAVQNTLLLHRAVGLGADWVVFLDCDEFIDPRLLDGSLHRVLESLPEQAPCAHTQAINYQPTALDDRDELIVPLKQRWRDSNFADFVKVFVRARAAGAGAIVGAGNHDAYLNGTPLPAYRDRRLLIAHYYMRSGWQILAKAFVGMMKFYASGEEITRQNHGIHYAHIFENLRDHPEWLLDDRAFLEGARPVGFYPDTLLDDPIDYIGGDLRYTSASDPKLKAIRSVVACAEMISRGHGLLADATEVTRRLVDDWGREFSPLAGLPRAD